MTIYVTHNVGQADEITQTETIYDSLSECHLEYDTFAAEGWGIVQTCELSEVKSFLRCPTRECDGVPTKMDGFCACCEDDFIYWRNYFSGSVEALKPFNREDYEAASRLK